MNQFGGNWTNDKIEVFIKYLKAYLEIMKNRSYFKLLYFDGFAGSGTIENDYKFTEGTALKVLKIDTPRVFDMYYFVEKDEGNALQLAETIQKKYLNNRTAYVVAEDCNKKIMDMAKFLTDYKNYRAIAFLDPYGMQINWKSIESLKGLGVDMWILVPTGQGVNRLLKKNGNISDSWWNKLENFLGMSRREIESEFYTKTKVLTLFGEETQISKFDKATEKLGKLYQQRLENIFKYVSEPFVMRNRKNVILYHFFMASNNKTAQKIANEIVKPKFK